MNRNIFLYGHMSSLICAFCRRVMIYVIRIARRDSENGIIGTFGRTATRFVHRQIHARGGLAHALRSREDASEDG
jgi:hypothetical protein